MLSSTLCFTIETNLHGTRKLTKTPFVIIARSSATLDPHIIRQALRCYPCRGCPVTCAEVTLKTFSTLFSIEELQKRPVRLTPSSEASSLIIGVRIGPTF